MYAAAGAVVAAASGMSWEEFVRTRIFAPLDMRGSVPTLAALAGQPNVASPHDKVKGTVQVIENASVDQVNAAGSIWSSVADMSKWMLLHDRLGRVNGKALLKPATWNDLLHAETCRPELLSLGAAHQAEVQYVRAGLVPARLRGPPAQLSHRQHRRHGRHHRHHPRSSFGVYVLGNLDHVEVRHALLYKAIDTWLGTGTRDWSTDLRAIYAGLAKEADVRRAKVEAGRVMGTKPSLPLDRYAGTYTHPLNGSLNVTVRDGRLHAQFGSGFVGPLEHWHYDTFKATWEARWRGTSLATFSLDAGGKVSGLASDQGRFTRVEP